MLKANAAYPGLIIRMTEDGSEPTANSRLYKGPIEVAGEVRLRTFDWKGRGSRVVVVR